MIARRRNTPEFDYIPDCPGDCPDDSAICRWKGADTKRMMKHKKYRTSAQQSVGCREEEPSCRQRRTRTSCAGFGVSGRMAISALLTSCWHPTMSTTAP